MTASTPLSGPELPPASGESAKHLVIFLHGFGADGHDLISIGAELAHQFPDTHFAAPNAPFPCDMGPFGYQWFSLQDRSPEALTEGAVMAAPTLDAYIDQKRDQLGLGDSDIALFGFSQGTMMALFVALQRKQTCAGILGYSGTLVGEKILEDQTISTPPVCLVHGNMDDVVPFTAMEDAENLLTSYRVPVKTHARPGLGHGIDAEGLRIGADFLASILK